MKTLYQTLLEAGPNLRPLQQIHTQLIVTGHPFTLPLLTKLTIFASLSGSLFYTRLLFSSIPNPDSFLFNSLIKTTSHSHFPLETIRFYRHMLRSNVLPSSYTFTSMLKSCAELKAVKLGGSVHCHALVNGYGLDVFVGAALVSFYAKCRELRGAKRVFDEMPDKTVVAWNAMISGYEQNGFAEEAIELFRAMRDCGVVLDSMSFVTVSAACAQVGDVELGGWVHEYVTRNDFYVNVVLGTALINMYAKCGYVRQARQVFDSMIETNVVAWTAMISGYAMHGYGREAVELFYLMRAQGIRPNDVTFVAVLSACAHAGLIQEGRWAYQSMKFDYSLVPGVEHHVCMVDMLGRAGLLNEAFQFIKDLCHVKPEPAVWTAILGACKMHKNFDLGVQVSEQLLAAEPENPGHYVLLSNMHALAGHMDRVETIRNIMIQKGLKKLVGYSTVEIDQKTYLFSMGDKSQPNITQIYRYLDELMQRCRDAGYVPASGSVMHELEEEEREYALRYHSERLAIAFGLLKTGRGIKIKIVKNLRICEDCHLAIKFISVVSNREIIVRDKLRFHSFKDGSCSCMDYW